MTPVPFSGTISGGKPWEKHSSVATVSMRKPWHNIFSDYLDQSNWKLKWAPPGKKLRLYYDVKHKTDDDDDKTEDADDDAQKSKKRKADSVSETQE